MVDLPPVGTAVTLPRRAPFTQFGSRRGTVAAWETTAEPWMVEVQLETGERVLVLPADASDPQPEG